MKYINLTTKGKTLYVPLTGHATQGKTVPTGLFEQPGPHAAYDIYLSGPMTGVPAFNFPAFESLTAAFRAAGFSVFNPAENFDGKTDLPREAHMRADFEGLLRSKEVVFLEGWRESMGAMIEAGIATELGLGMWEQVEPDAHDSKWTVGAYGFAPTGVDIYLDGPNEDESVLHAVPSPFEEPCSQAPTYAEFNPPEISILDEAKEIVGGTRRQDYGTPYDNHTRTAHYWQEYLDNTNHPLTGEDVCFLNILQKVARAHQRLTRDTLVDIAGYAANVNLVREGRRAAD